MAASVFALATASALIVGDDAAATAANVLASEQAFRLGFVANLIAAVAYVGVVAMLYELFKPVNATLSVVAAFLGLAGCAISGAGMINTLAALLFWETPPIWPRSKQTNCKRWRGHRLS